ncbi:hypothetical protein T12_7866 [Trichinella patagoniensis]|uniref:Uncharacterized protein n=1 Tax=Trichinella patagoniensis TaxID=990121 RepID=A0A0V0YZD1_9BILA|nr:hypothetical protein T12_7866 [Trichinella patagoniensis]
MICNGIISNLRCNEIHARLLEHIELTLLEKAMALNSARKIKKPTSLPTRWCLQGDQQLLFGVLTKNADCFIIRNVRIYTKFKLDVIFASPIANVI